MKLFKIITKFTNIFSFVRMSKLVKCSKMLFNAIHINLLLAKMAFVKAFFFFCLININHICLHDEFENMVTCGLLDSFWMTRKINKWQQFKFKLRCPRKIINLINKKPTYGLRELYTYICVFKCSALESVLPVTTKITAVWFQLMFCSLL